MKLSKKPHYTKRPSTSFSNILNNHCIPTVFRPHKRESIGGEAVIVGSEAIFDSSTVTGTETGVKNKYIARIKPQHLDVEMDERAALRQLFTQTSSATLDAEEKTRSSMPTT